jgi:Xaa-Pro aminopeptidase
MKTTLVACSAVRNTMIPLSRHKDFLVPHEEIRQRIKTLQGALKDNGLSAAWVDYLTDRYYYTGSIQDGVLLVPAEQEPLFFVRKSLKRAEVESPLRVVPYPGRRGLLRELCDLVGTEAPVGVPFDVTPTSTYVWLSTSSPRCSLADISMSIRLQKATKSTWEIAQIRKAADQATSVFEAIGDYLHTGITELELCASVEKQMRLVGHGGTLRIRRAAADITSAHVAAGSGALYPTNFDGPVGGEGLYPASPGSGRKVIAESETVLVDIVTSYNGYHADHTRAYYLGQDIPQKAATAHRFCLDVLQRIEEQLRPGASCATIYTETNAWAEKRGMPQGFMGYGENRVKFFGHGIGTELDEFPILAAKVDLELLPGMVVAVEPKAFLDGIGPVGVENTYVITADGCESLCTVPYEIRTIAA